MELKFGKQIKILALCFMLFGVVIAIIELVFSLLFKETLYFVMLALSCLLVLILLFLVLYSWNFKLKIDKEGFHIKKIFSTRSYTYEKNDIKKIKLNVEKHNVEVVLIDSKDKKLTSFTCNNLTDEQFKTLQGIIKEDVEVSITEEEAINVDK